jgi:hypothetical protein
MAHLDLETWRKTDKEAYGSEVIDPGGTYDGPCLDKLSAKMLHEMQGSVTHMNYREATE